MRKIYTLLFFIFLVKISSAQVTLTVNLAKDSMQIGDVNVYRMQLSHPANVTIRSIDLKPLATDPLTKERFYQDTSFTNNPEKMKQVDEYFRQQGFSREVMEITNYGNWKAPNESMMLTGSEATWIDKTVGGKVVKTNELQFTFFEEGIHKILSPVIEYEQSGGLRTTTTQDVGIIVGSPLALESKPIDSLTIAPIKDVIEEPIDWVQDVLIPVGLFLLGCIVLGLLIYYFIKKPAPTTTKLPELEEYIPPSMTALQQLDVLKNEKIWQQGKVKEYQSQLTHIIREYLENRYDINALENTTFQIGEDLKSLNLNESLRNDLQHILQVADLVKFAKAQPDENIHEQFLVKAEEFVNTTKKTTAQVEAEKAARETAHQQALEDLKNKKEDVRR